VGGAGAHLAGDEEEDGDIPGEARLARRQRPEMADPAAEAVEDGAGGRGGGAARLR
jgi:hypothetical protein